MTSESLGPETTIRQRRQARLALLRALLALAYVAAELVLSRPASSIPVRSLLGLFLVYSLVLLAWRAHPRVQTFSLFILFLDLLFLLLLVFGATTGRAALAALFYVFLVLESVALHGGREVILIATAVSLVFYGARIQGAPSQPLSMTVHSVLFLLVVGGLLALLFSDRRYLVERRIAALAHQAAGASVSGTAAAIEEALKQLAGWFGCSRALLAFWGQRQERYFLVRHPPAEESSRESSSLEESREWAAFRAAQMEFFTNQAASAAPSDLDPQLIRRFQIHNALSCGLYHQAECVGRLVLINRVSPWRPYLLRRLKRVAPAFTELALHVLVLQSVEHVAFESERSRVAQDFHDGPLQSVISFQMRVHLVRKLLDRDPAAAAQELDQLQELAGKQVTEMRTFVNSMRPVETDSSTLTAAARRLVEAFQKESGVPVTFMGGEQPITAPGKIGVDILHIIREALHNIHKHSQASHVLFSLEKSDNAVLIAVNDNGKGFRFGGKYSLEELEQLRLGPQSIKQRMRALGGEVLLESQPGHGASLRLKIPLA